MPTETFQYMNFYSCHPTGMKKGFIKGEVLRLLRTNSLQITFEEYQKFSKPPVRKGLPCCYFKKVPLWGKICRQENSPTTETNPPVKLKTSTFCYTKWPALPNLKKILMGNGTLYKTKRLRKIFKEPPLISHHRGKSLNWEPFSWSKALKAI